MHGDTGELVGDLHGDLVVGNEDELNPVSVIFWYQLIEWIGDLADYAEKVGNRLRLLIAR